MPLDTSYMIPWDLLLDEEQDFLEDAGVKLLPRTVEFTKELSWEAFTIVFTYINRVERRIYPKGDNPIHFALGDTLNYGEKLFGEEAIEQFMHDFVFCSNLRDQILSLAGAVLVYLQSAEFQLKFFCAATNADSRFTLDDLFSSDSKRRRKTLGQLRELMIQSGFFTEDFETKLEQFVKDRNNFIHNLWIDKSLGRKDQSIPSKEELTDIYDFLISLLKQIRYIEKLFLGFQSSWLQSFPGADDSSESLQVLEIARRWARYIPEFEQILKEKLSQSNN